ncbi:MAG: nitrogenase-stabilizing/protective protein NifW [Candidatus Thiodiazotropha lotti]|uniref:Nitrogenase-stabilizing/protective protein NifW n=1 Tax=Candidatus Thiodiazotropha endoloripes TaxID=1818881 RepID=A0A1E2USU8_9GAMM|nr:nitrogenase-stabilizing/protective protein NifW [Candidatus Thiodiazotropha endoloripes]MCG7900157.1 nitrogenase-stabilizing/protective protein NifW [Candidatus Thiodiazotropha weberae]MCG7990670.1 nitrogenase-stabilizing/protective protein NifW [Candidatus Thiodiazotropha lotti]MCG7901310.1 nitrogenase-stabilizing/protective protein NifW [Candidatus Thiodiazotropha weberae]MCG7915814.1 nitrogenase-stabilizing/protective protein NifW [Candidatus Thiodiazotropha weberae]MCG7999465.1 nitrogen
MSESEFELDMDELSSAEDFLEYFEIEYDPSVVHVNRLHILQRFHDYLDDISAMPESDDEKYQLYAGMLNSAYSDFVESDALTEKVFKVFHMHEPVTVSVPLMDLSQQVNGLAPKV